MKLSEEQLYRAASVADSMEMASLPDKETCPKHIFSEKFENDMMGLMRKVKNGKIAPYYVHMGWQYYAKRGVAVFVLCTGLACVVMPEAVMAACRRIVETDFLAIIRNSTFRLIFVYLVQFVLCTRENKFLGLLLPAYYFISSVILMVNSFNSAYFMEMNRIFHIYLVFIVPNVNTTLFLFMYFVLRKFYVEKNKWRGDSHD